MTWQPIETAPRDGTHILLGGMTYGLPVDVGSWGTTDYNRKERTYNKGWTVNPGYVANPTHWQYLPEPPQ